jgi:hypothetical protein
VSPLQESNTPLWAASRFGHAAIVRLLLDAKAQVHTIYILLEIHLLDESFLKLLLHHAGREPRVVGGVRAWSPPRREGTVGCGWFG